MCNSGLKAKSTTFARNITTIRLRSQNDEVVVTTPVESRIMSIRGNQIMIDRDLAELYGVETKRLNEAVKRNIELLILEIRINPYTKDFTPNEKTLQEYDRLGITIY